MASGGLSSLEEKPLHALEGGVGTSKGVRRMWQHHLPRLLNAGVTKNSGSLAHFLKETLGHELCLKKKNESKGLILLCVTPASPCVMPLKSRVTLAWNRSQAQRSQS